MKANERKISVTSSLIIIITLLTGLFLPARPASAGEAVWSAETIPSRVDNVLSPAGVDIRDFEIAGDHTTIYAVPGDSTSDNVVYKSLDTGVTWAAINLAVRTDLVAVAPDDNNIATIARKNTPAIYVTINGGSSWESLGIPQESGSDAAAIINDIAVSGIREGVRYIAAAGTDTAGEANMWYYGIGAGFPAWQETNNLPGFSNGDEVATLAFSPYFSVDAALVVISETDNTGVMLQVLNIVAETWNGSANYIDFPCSVISNGGITGLAAASLSLSPNYLGTDEGRRRVFIGLTVNGNASAIAASGIYRFDDTLRTELYTNAKIHSVAFNGSYLVAGSQDTNTVYRSTNPTATTPTFLPSTPTKGPGGEGSVIIAWRSNSVFAATSGNESAFAISTDSGATFNDISLIDTVITNARDVAVSPDGNQIYLVTDDGSDTSLWRKSSSWKRVFSQPGTTNYIVRIAPQNTNIIYLTKKSTATIYYNDSSGLARWLTRTCNLYIQDMAVESASILYALNSAGSVSRSSNAGASWDLAVATSLNSGATLISVSTDTLFAGSQDGYVAYSTNGNSTWTKITPILQAGAGNIQVIADANYATNKLIYAASDTAGQNIKRWKIGTSTEWTDVFYGILNGGIYGLAITGGKIYALEYNAVTAQSTLWILISPETAPQESTEWSHSTTTTTTDNDDASVRLNATPRALKVSTGKLWAVKTNNTNKLYSFSEVAIEIKLLTPGLGFSNPVNNLNGLAYDMSFTWERPSIATEYELELARDKEFEIHVTTITIATTTLVASVIIGPNQAGNNMVNFVPGVTYYWRIRTTKPLLSNYSVSRHFFIAPITAIVPEILTPANGSINVSRKPSFSWNPVAGATEYQFVLSANITMDKPIVDVMINTAGFAMAQELDYGGMYFWQIRATQPVETDWSPLSSFTVAELPTEPVPPVTFKTLPPEVVELPAPPPPDIITLAPPPQSPPSVVPDYLRTAVIIASGLLLVLIVLIIVPAPAKLLPAPSSLARPLAGPYRRARNVVSKMGMLWEKLAIRIGDLIPYLAPKRAAGEAVESDDIAFAVRSFLLLKTAAVKDSGQPRLSAGEEQTLGQNLTSRIRAIAREKPLYLAFPEDAATFLQIWAHYGSRTETDRYLSKSFKSRPENAVDLLKCFVAVPVGPDTSPPDNKEFTRARYDALAQVIDPARVYTAITSLLKIRFEKEEEQALEDPAERAIAYQFVRIHYHLTHKKEEPDTAPD